MQRLRSIHLYLGCIFAPLLLFFAVSGIWQTLGMRSPFLQLLSTIHTQARMKDGSEMGSFPFRILVVLMAMSFIITTALGVIMVLKYGRSRRIAVFCLAAGAIVPGVLVLMRLL